MKEVDVLVIGGGPAAIISAVVSKQLNPTKKIVNVRNFPTVLIPCGIPYTYNSLNSVDDDILGPMALKKNDIDLIIDEMIDGDINEKVAYFKSGEKIKYDKLILATGSNPIIPTFIPGYDKENVFIIKKDYEYLKKLHDAVQTAKKVVVIGGGFIGMEFADELLNKGLDITIVEMMEHALIAAFDPEFCKPVEEKFREDGAKIMTGKKIVAIGGADKVEYVELASGEKIDADLVLVSIGSRPNVKLAEKLGLKIEDRSGIWVDEYTRSSNKDIFAVGDCAAKIDFFTRRPTPVMLASTACTEARIASASLYTLDVVRENKGTIGVFSTNLRNISLGTAGLTESAARKAGFNVIASTSTSVDRHPGKFTDTTPIKVKLIFSRSCGTILGGQAIGGKSIGEIINVIGLAVQQRLNVSELFTLQIGTHPLLTSAPTTYPIVTAAQSVLVRIKKERS